MAPVSSVLSTRAFSFLLLTYKIRDNFEVYSRRVSDLASTSSIASKQFRLASSEACGRKW
jgi:hypothetical protein